jgi:putative membrane protein
MPAKYPLLLLALVLGALALSAIHPRDTQTWWLEVLPVFLALPILLATWRRFPLTSLASTLIAIHAGILILGGHYTYAEVPLGEWMRELFHTARNPYDRLGHFAQGFVPAILAREVLLRTSPLRRGGWLFFLVTCVCLAISAFYELVEWWTALASEEAAANFLGAQGDIWDAQWDMLCALSGALLAQLLLGRLHDRQLAKLAAGQRTPPARGREPEYPRRPERGSL